jgi:hypothetical protein
MLSFQRLGLFRLQRIRAPHARNRRPILRGGRARFLHGSLGYHRIDPIKASLIAAGFGDIAAHVVRIEKTITNARSFAHGLILGNPIAAEIAARGAAIVAALAAALQREFGQEAGCMTMQAIVFVARIAPR